MNLWAAIVPIAGNVALILAVMRTPEFKLMQYFHAEALADGFRPDRAVAEAAYMMYDLVEMSPGWEAFRQFMGLKTESKEYPVLESDDQISAVCKFSMYTRITEVEPPFALMDTADPLDTQDRLWAYIESCIEVYKKMPEDSPQRKLLDSFKPPLGIPGDLPNLTQPTYHGPQNLTEYNHMRRDRYYAGLKKPDLTSRRLTKDEIEPEWARERMAKNAILPVRPEFVPGKDAVKALMKGKVVVFDATEILPKRLFNKSLVDIAEMHQDVADDIPVYKTRGGSVRFGWDSLGEVKERLQLLGKAGKLYHPEEVPIPQDPSWQVPKSSIEDKEGKKLMEEASKKIGADAQELAHAFRRAPGQTTVNIRRLPKLNISMEDALGNPEWMERCWSMFWSGAVGSFWHNDEPDNFIISVNKEVNVGVFTDMQDTDLINGKKNPGDAPNPGWFDLAAFHPDNVTDEWLKSNLWLHYYPYVRLRLKPGQGVTVPSRMYHSVWSEDTERIVLNAFMVPKFGALKEAKRPKNSWYDQQDPLYLALFHLKMSSLFHLWDTRKIGGFFSGTKLEIL